MSLGDCVVIGCGQFQKLFCPFVIIEILRQDSRVFEGADPEEEDGDDVDEEDENGTEGREEFAAEKVADEGESGYFKEEEGRAEGKD